MPSRHNHATQRKKFALKNAADPYSDARISENDLRRRAKFIESLANATFRHENFLKIRSRPDEIEILGSQTPSCRRVTSVTRIVYTTMLAVSAAVGVCEKYLKCEKARIATL